MMDTSPGKIYKESGKVNMSKYIIYFVIGLILHGLLGIGYGFLSHANPLIYLNFLLLGLVVVLVAVINRIIIPSMESRNSMVKYAYIIIAAFFLFYNAWAGTIGFESSRASVWDAFSLQLSMADILDFAGQQNMSIGKFGRDGFDIGGMLGIFYLIEMLILIFAPVYFASQSTEYFCEKCQQNYVSKTAYFTKSKFDDFSKKEEGDLMEVAEEAILDSRGIPQLRAGVNLVQFDFYICRSCSSGVADVEFGKAVPNDKNVNEYKKEKTISKGLYLNQKTTEFMDSRFEK